MPVIGRGQGGDYAAPSAPILGHPHRNTSGVKAGPKKPVTYGPPGGLPGLNGQPWKHDNGQVGFSNSDGSFRAIGAPVPGPAPAPETDYDSLFKASLDRQRGAIDAQLRQVMGDIGARRTQADEVIARQPAEVNALYNQAAPAIDTAAKGAQASLKSAGASTPTGAQDAGIQAIRGAIETNRASAAADAPYLKIGTTDLFNRQAGAAQQAGLEAKAGVDAQMTDYLGQRAGAQYQAKLGEDAAVSDFNRRLLAATASNDPKQQAAQKEKEGLQAATPSGTAKWWQAHALVDPTGANKMAANYNLNPQTLKYWQENPDGWQQAQEMLTPELVSFLKFNYGLK